MGQPTPPGDLPLFEGLGTEWNDIVGALPEDKRGELAPKIKQHLDSYVPESYKPYENFQKSGITPDHIETALNVFTLLENKPREVYEAIGQHLGITPQQAKEVVDDLEKGKSDDDEDPRYAALQQQVEVLAQIALAKNKQELETKQAAEQDALLEKELNDLKKKYGDDVDEEEVLMRAIHKNMSLEQAYQEYANKVSLLRQRRAAPMILGGSGSVPNRAIDPKTLDSAKTRALVAQMMEHANAERNQ